MVWFVVRERWGTLSVVDHIDQVNLATNLLLYDRLVFPVPGEEDWGVWKKKEWEPDLQEKRLVKLEGLAIPKRWSTELREEHRHNMEELNWIIEDAEGIIEEQRKQLGYELTRRILQQKKYELPKNVHHVDVVTAYRSKGAFLEGCQFSEEATEERKQAQLSFMLGNKIAIPKNMNPRRFLAKAIELARNEEFREKRQAFYDWQVDVIETGYSEEYALKEMDQMIIDYNSCIKNKMKDVTYKFVFTLANVALAVAEAAAGSPFVLANGFLAVVSFFMSDLTRDINAGAAKPAAMFHDIRRSFGWKETV